jgi:hypothetical protein
MCKESFFLVLLSQTILGQFRVGYFGAGDKKKKKKIIAFWQYTTFGKRHNIQQLFIEDTFKITFKKKTFDKKKSIY